MKVDLDDVDRKARAATQGRWIWGAGNIEGSRGRANGLYVEDPGRARPVLMLEPGSLYTTLASDCAHIAAASPQVVLALIAYVRELEDAVKRAADYLHTPGDPDPRDIQDVIEGDLRALVAKGAVIP